VETFLTLDGGEWSASCSSCIVPREKATDIHWTEGWVDLRASLY